MKPPTRVPGIVLCYLTLGPTLVWGLEGTLHGSVELPCVHHQLPGPMEQITVYWQRKNLPTDLVVATVLDGKVDTRFVDEIFRGRAHFNTDRFHDGDFTLTLTNLSLQDSGDYDCIILWETNKEVKNNRMELEVRAEFSTPVVGDMPSSHKLQYGQEKTLTCTSHGGLELLKTMWINAMDGREVQDGRVHQDVQKNGEIINVTSTITLNITSNIDISCVLVTKNGNVTSEPYKMEVTEDKETYSPCALIVSVIIGGVAAVALTVILVKWRQIQGKCPPSYQVPINQTSEL